MDEELEEPDCVSSLSLEISGHHQLFVLFGGLDVEFGGERDQQVFGDHFVVHELGWNHALDELSSLLHAFG